MSGPVIGTVLKLAGTVLAGKAVVEGLKEGNILKAALGGLGAYMGLNSLGAFQGLGTGAGSAMGAVSAGQELGKDLVINNAAEIGSNLGTQAASSLTADAAMAAADLVRGPAVMQTGTVIGQAAPVVGGALAGSVTPDLAAGTVTNPASTGIFGGNLFGEGTNLLEGDNVLSKAGSWVKENPALALMGGSMLSGFATGQSQQDQLEYKQGLVDAARARTGYRAPLPGDFEAKMARYSQLFGGTKPWA